MKYGIPYILDAHGSLPRKYRKIDPKFPLKWLFDIFFGNVILRDASRFIAETGESIRQYRELGVNPDKIVMITPPFDIEEFSRLPPNGTFRKKYDINEQHIVLFMGRIHWIKGIDFLVESFGELAKLRNDAVLIIAGNDDGYLSTLKRMVGELKLTDKVVFTGFIGGEDRLAAMVDADVVIQTSVYEQGTGVPFEAVLCGTPIIVSKNTYASENVKDIDAGYLVEYGNNEELAGTIQQVFENPEEGRQKAQRAGKYIRENLSLEKAVMKYEQVYDEVINSS
jgi:glycosyltransferase involved in cell wall biosynthesis